MKCIAGFNMMAFPVSKPWWHLYFLSKYNELAEVSERKQVQSSLNTFFGGKQDRESNTTPTAPAACSSDQGNTEVSRIVERKVQMAPLWWKRKQNVSRICREFPNGKEHTLFLRAGTNNWRHTRSMRPVKGMLWAQQPNMQAREQGRKDPYQLCLLHWADLSLRQQWSW